MCRGCYFLFILVVVSCPALPSPSLRCPSLFALRPSPLPPRPDSCYTHFLEPKTVDETDLLLSFRERYTTIKRLVISPATATITTTLLADKDGEFLQTNNQDGRDVLVEVQFSGPQPSEGPGALLCALLCGSSFEAQPVELARGRKKRSRIAEPVAAEAGECGVIVFFCLTSK